jgi:hypothetical protein
MESQLLSVASLRLQFSHQCLPHSGYYRHVPPCPAIIILELNSMSRATRHWGKLDDHLACGCYLSCAMYRALFLGRLQSS